MLAHALFAAFLLITPAGKPRPRTFRLANASPAPLPRPISPLGRRVAFEPFLSARLRSGLTSPVTSASWRSELGPATATLQSSTRFRDRSLSARPGIRAAIRPRHSGAWHFCL